LNTFTTQQVIDVFTMVPQVVIAISTQLRTILSS